MSDFGGLGGALMISQQLAAYRLEDDLRRARDNSALAANDTGWRNQYNDLVNRYNRLVQDAHRLADVQDQLVNNQDRQIAELKEANASLATEVERLRCEVVNIRYLLRQEDDEEKTLREQSKGV